MTRLFLIFALLFSLKAHAVPKRYVMRSEKTNSVYEGLQNRIDDVQYEASNREAELRMFEEKMNNQEIALDTLWKQFSESVQMQKDKMKANSESVETKISGLETKNKKALSEIKELQNHANASSTTLEEYKKKIANLEKIVEIQNQNVEHLQAALKALMEALQIRDVAIEMEDPFESISSGVIYQVKAGDSLEKIARKNHTTVAKLKAANNLTNNKDLIIVGQKLKLP